MLFEALRLALSTVFRNKLRSFLTVLGDGDRRVVGHRDGDGGAGIDGAGAVGCGVAGVEPVDGAAGGCRVAAPVARRPMRPR